MIINIQIIKKKTYNTAIAISKTDVMNVINYFFKTMKGMKALEYRI